ncbi:cornifelin-like [Cheilinus undulatus]|uniref:cornifelin-like n=1 Tax=Cheilinus undulatus TaxID=241271 RepID=UPI001BD6B27C|nr:cornifelin-like [Cheilinus undulatus]XP_041647411.1 cornifelin-like [Cheilinus undulatus]XP_041647412.1 cornifelin-like [Cheilinus undulatus]
MSTQPLVEWETGLLDCFEEASTCCYGFWCCPCLTCTVSGRFGENTCLSLWDIGSTLLTLYGIPLCVPPAALSMRVAMRNRYGIKGSLCNDIAVSCFCRWCSWCQMHRELKHRKKYPTFVNVHNQTVFAMQPAPAMMMPRGFVAQQNVGTQQGVVTQQDFVKQQGVVTQQDSVNQPGVMMTPY